jgi:hypothetical protein
MDMTMRFSEIAALAMKAPYAVVVYGRCGCGATMTLTSNTEVPAGVLMDDFRRAHDGHSGLTIWRSG